MARRLAVRSYTVPPPTGGWNARDPLDLMAESDAVTLTNIFPAVSAVVQRGGSRVHATGVGAGTVETVAEFAGDDGSRQLIAASGGKIYNATSYNTAATEIGTGFTEDRWQCVQFAGSGTPYLLLFNGEDTPQKWDGTTLSSAVYGLIPDPTTLIQPSIYKSRLYVVQIASQSLWYGDTNAVTGDLTEFYVGPLLRLGGYVQFAGSWTRDTAAGLNDYFVIVSNLGEVLIYAGTDPETDFTLVGHYFAPAPLGRRAFVQYGADLAIITQQGVVPLSTIISGAERSSYAQVTDKIRNAFTEAARLYGDNFGWCGLAYPKGNMAIINVPTSEGITAQQYVVNTLNGSWCNFTGLNANCWTLLNEKPYFGGNGGKIYQFDVGYSDSGSPIACSMLQAYDYFENRAQTKRFTRIKPIVSGVSNISFSLGVSVDYQPLLSSSSVSLSGRLGGEWDEDDWDSAEWGQGSQYLADWFSVEGIGRSAAVSVQGTFVNAPFTLSATQIIYELGGLI